MSEQSVDNGDIANPVSEEHIAFTTQFSDNLEVQASTTPEGTAVTVEHDPFDAFVRLVIGTGLVGVEELGRYLQEWEKTAREEEAQIAAAQEETQAAVIRYAVLGAIFEAKDFVRRVFLNWGRRREIWDTPLPTRLSRLRTADSSSPSKNNLMF